MGNAGAYFGFTNTSASACWVQGYPTVALFDEGGHRIDSKESHSSSYQITDPGPERVALGPGATGWFGIGWAARTNEGDPVPCIAPAALEATPPSGTRMRLPVHLKAYFCPSSGFGVTALGLRSSFPLADPEG